MHAFKARLERQRLTPAGGPLLLAVAAAHRRVRVVGGARILAPAGALSLIVGSGSVVASARSPAGAVGPLTPFGATRFAASTGLMFLGYVLLIAGAPALRRATLTAICGGVALLLTVRGPLFSTDVYGYADYARLAVVHHLNPYTSPPLAEVTDPLYRLVFWRHQTSPYGPLFTLLSEPFALGSPRLAVWSLQALAGLGGFASILLAGRAADHLGLAPVPAMAFVGANPTLLLWGVGGAHNELVVMAAVSLGVLLIVEGRVRPGGAAFALAVGLKLTGGLGLPFALIAAPGRRRLLLGFAAASAPIWAVALALFGPHLFDQVIAIATQRTYEAPHSLPVIVGAALGGGLSAPLRVAFLIALLAATGAAMLGLARGRIDWLSAAGWTGVAALVCLPTTQLWYLAWVLPLAAVARSRRLRIAVLLLSLGMAAANPVA